MKNIKSLTITIIVILLLPLPLALALSGGEAIFGGSGGVTKEFLVSYLFGIFTLLAGLFWYLWRANRGENKKK